MDKTITQEFEGVVREQAKQLEAHADKESEVNGEASKEMAHCEEGHHKTHDLIDDMKRQNETMAEQLAVLTAALGSSNRRCCCERI